MPFNNTYYPKPTMNQTQDLLGVFQFINTASLDLFFPIMILVIFVVQVTTVIAEGRKATGAFIFGAFTSFILSVMLGILALISSQWIYLIVLILAFSLFWLKLVGARE